MHYVSNTSEEARVKEQQAIIQKALQELSIKSKLEQQQEHEKLISKHHLKPSPVNFDLWLHSTKYSLVTNECRPYSPYYNSGSFSMSDTASTCTRADRQRTPSMISASSSYISENTTTTASSSVCSQEDNACLANPLETLSERDMYGFKRPFQWVNKAKLMEFEQRYKLVQKKQAKGWKKLIVNNDQQWPALCPQLNRYVRKGIPHAMRAKVWMHYSGAQKKLQENPGRYSQLVETDAKSEHADAIQKDLHRTFPDNSYFSCDVQHKDGSTTVAPESNQKIQQLRRVLLAFSVYSPSIGYCQSLNFLAGFLLLILSEEEAFWMLVTIVHDIFPQNVFDTTMEGANIEQTVLMMMLYEKMPCVWTKMASKKCFWECEQKEELPPITLLTSHWFLTLFINILPVETVLRIWDCFFVGEGCKVLYQVALTIFKLNEQRIRNAKDSTETFQILQNMPKRVIDCDQFMKCVFSPENDVAQVTNQDINSKRDLFKSQNKIDAIYVYAYGYAYIKSVEFMIRMCYNFAFDVMIWSASTNRAIIDINRLLDPIGEVSYNPNITPTRTYTLST
ncbi:hypothetical protein [Parasitella parasitica]|uniref:Rab-GAP TBC domain-containing protein n=1 Tax=Parasitella parasitica TaxID=35722 RepID=A0A0B7NAB0_9FUNG|nr:hypothetical protein [Parasitella parasitica]